MNEHHYAVVVGVNHYPEMGSLNSPVNDAKKFTDWLQNADGGKLLEDNIMKVISPENENSAVVKRRNAKPNRTDVFEAIYELFERCAEHLDNNPDDWDRTRLYIYFSGHGIAPEADNTILLMANSAPKIPGESVACSPLKVFFEEARCFKEVIIFADCCRNWGNTSPVLAPPWSDIRYDYGPVNSLTGYATVFGDPAYEPKEEELEHGDSRRSYFTQALIEGLEGKAQVNTRIDSITLAEYITRRVPELTKGKTRPQQPQIIGELNQRITFREDVADVNTTKYEITIRNGSGYTGPTVLLGGNRTELMQFDNMPDVVTVSLKAEYHRIRPKDQAVDNPFVDNGFFGVDGGRDEITI